MKKSLSHIVKTFAATMTAAALLAGCASSESQQTVNKYTADSGMYAVSLPGEWKSEDSGGLQEIMVLSRDDGMEAVFIGMVKGRLWGNAGGEVEDLTGFFDYMDSLFLNGPSSATELKDAESMNMAGLKNSMAKEGTMTETGVGSAEVFLECAETENAYYMFMFSGSTGYRKKLAAIKSNMAFEELEVPKPDTLADTLRWFNASNAILMQLNGGELDIVAGFEPSVFIEGTMRGLLEQSWDVTDRASLDETVEWLLTEGHNEGAVDYLAELVTDDMSREELALYMEEGGFTADEQGGVLALYDAKALYGDQAIKGWDLSRAMSIYGWGYLAGYYTYEEAMDKSLETAKMIQGIFHSWDDFTNSYLLGYAYWSDSDLDDTSSDAYSRKQVYEEIKTQDNSPFDVDWNLSFQKEW